MPITDKPRQKKPKRDRRLILSSAQFIAGFVPPDYVIEGIVQRRFVYSLTGKTGAGKTTILLLVAAHVAEGKKIGDRDIERGRVLYFAGENADDERMRWIALAQQMGFDPDISSVHFIPGVFKMSAVQNRIRSEIKQIGDVSLIIVDTAAAYFEGDDENSNTQFGDYAERQMIAQVEALAMQGAPSVSLLIEHDGKIAWQTQQMQSTVYNAQPRAVAFTEVPDAVALVAWLHRDALIAALDREISTESDDPASLSHEARQKAEAEILGDVLEQDRIETEMVFAAQSQGLPVEHRPDISPLALLGVRLVTTPRADALPETTLGYSWPWRR
jgi:hypothetical protein